jgi:hypothetical protein
MSARLAHKALMVMQRFCKPRSLVRDRVWAPIQSASFSFSFAAAHRRWIRCVKSDWRWSGLLSRPHVVRNHPDPPSWTSSQAAERLLTARPGPALVRISLVHQFERIPASLQVCAGSIFPSSRDSSLSAKPLIAANRFRCQYCGEQHLRGESTTLCHGQTAANRTWRAAGRDNAYSWNVSFPSVRFGAAAIAGVRKGDKLTRQEDGSVWLIERVVPDGFGRTTLQLTSRKRAN